MKAIKIPVAGDIQTVELPDSEKKKGEFLHECQEQVGGLIEIVRPRLLYGITMMPHTACMIVDENFIANRKPVNRRATQLYGAHSICGDVLILDLTRTPDGYDIAGFEDNLAESISFIMSSHF